MSQVLKIPIQMSEKWEEQKRLFRFILMESDLAIGIDLGTTYCCIAVVNNGVAKVIANREGHRTTLSKVYLDESEVHVGKNAEVYRPGYDFRNEIYDMKRIIGCMYDDPAIQNDAEMWPFSIQRGNNGEVLVCFQRDKRKCITLPEQICALMLSYLKRVASEYLDQDIKKAVITVPTYFNTCQRQATRESARIAGLEVLSLINEPSAAALAYVFDRYSKKDGNILIYDLGGGTFDVSIISVSNRQMNVKAVSGDTHLGGTDFLNELVKYVIDELKVKYSILKLSPRTLRRIKAKCQEVMTNLSSLPKAYVYLEVIEGQEDVTIEITRTVFENLNQHHFTRTMEIVENCLKLSNFTKDDITEVLLIGGCTRIPKIQRLLESYFGEHKIKKTANPDEAVAIGAAYQASFLNNQSSLEFSLIDVLPLSLGYELNGSMQVLIPRNTPLPHSTERKEFIRVETNRCSLAFYEGESKDPEENVFLGAVLVPYPSYSATNLMSRISIKMSVTKQEEIDITVTNCEKNTNKSNHKRLTLTASRINENIIDDMNFVLQNMTL